MNRFLIILRKELKELISVQLIIPVVLIFVLFYVMGDLFKAFDSTEIEVHASDIQSENHGESLENPDEIVTISTSSIIGLIDNDNSEMSEYIINGLKQSGITVVTPSSADPAAACEELLDYELYGTKVEIKVLAVINSGFGENITADENIFIPIDIYSSINTFGLMSSISSFSSANAVNIINELVSQKLFERYMPDVDLFTMHYIKSPVYEQSHTYMNGETAKINSGAIIGYITSNTMFVPIIVMIILIYSMQTLATSVVNEKADKTLETLMTTPVNRMAVLFAKVLSAAIYAIVFAGVYVWGFQNYMSGMMGSEVYPAEMLEIIENFGISFNFFTFSVIGVQLFLSVLCGLGVALIIGIILEDIKTLQAYIVPIMFVIMIPYFVTMFTDINTLPMIFKILIYIIPFTHTFAAATNVFTQNYTILIGGIIYQIIFVIAMLVIAMKIFNSDKLITLSEIIKSRGAKKKQGQGIKLFNK